MGLFKRIGDLLSANLNDLIEHCENPERMLKQAIRELEAAVGRALDAAARAIAQQRLLVRQQSEQQRGIDRCTKVAEAAVRRDDDAAARQALRRKMEHEQFSLELSEQVETAQNLGDRLRKQVTAMRLTLSQARRKLVDVTVRHRAATARRQFAAHLESSTRNAGPLTNFDRACADVEQSEAETEALLELLGSDPCPFQPDADIEAELQALKENLGHVGH